MSVQQTFSPVDGRLLVERELAGAAQVEAVLEGAVAAQRAWARTPLDARIAALTTFVDAIVADTDVLSEEITWQMGRPISQTPGEIRGFEDRARTMLALAPESLADLAASDKPGFTRFVRREPVGVVLVLAPWNYPYLTAVNTLVPALVAGNAVVLKHSDQTPLCAERLHQAAVAAGLDAALLGVLHTTHETTARIVADERIAYVAFTGSVPGGRAVHAAAGGHFKGVGLELGGKDPAYVRADADLGPTVSNLVDGTFFNSGQSCCGIERIYVHRDRHAEFVEAFVAETLKYRLGDPTDPTTNLGPVVRARSAAAIQAQIDAAVTAGARALIDPARFGAARPGSPYLAPQVLIGVDHSMQVMREETFGPVVGIMAIDGDEQAIALMNDSAYGLTASLWTADLDRAMQLGERLQTGTVFANRCDALDPELAWVGVKDSGRGCTLSRVGFEALTRPKSFHLRHQP